MTAIAQFVEDEEHVAYIQCNATLQVIVEVDVTAQRFPVAVESSTDELSFAIDDGLPELPPVMSFVVRKQTGMVPSAMA